jgi:phenylalanyl-tRNA synthetase alpha chain
MKLLLRSKSLFLRQNGSNSSSLFSRANLCSQSSGGPAVSKSSPPASTEISINGQTFKTDDWTNVSPHIISLMDRKLHMSQNHPLGLIKCRIIDYMYGKYTNSRGNPLFSIHEGLSPIVTLQQNYDSLLVPTDHPSRKKSDSYYINRNQMLRAHTSAHQVETRSCPKPFFALEYHNINFYF